MTSSLKNDRLEPRGDPCPTNDLLERVGAATGPDREIDAEIAWACLEEDWSSGPERAVSEPFAHIKMLPEYTASLDAALALVERVLPGWLPSVEKRRGLGAPPTGMVSADIAGRSGWEGWTGRVRLTAGIYYFENAPTPAIALLAAMLRAIKQQCGEELT